MSFSNTVVFNSYAGNDSDDTFNVTFTFLTGESQIAVKVYDLTGSEAQEVIPTPTFVINEGTQQVVFTAPPTSDQLVVLHRLSDTLQEVVYNDYRFPFDTVERHFDRVALLVQEHDKMLETAGLKDFYNPNGNDSTKYNLLAHTLGNFDAVTGNLVYLTDPTNTVTIFLPATPNEGDEVIVKEASGAIANKSVDANGETIVGFGATYALQSIYESVRFVYSTAGWLMV